ALIVNKFTPTILQENIMSLTRLNLNIAVTLMSQHIGIVPDRIHNILIWGSHTENTLPDASRGIVLQLEEPQRFKITDFVEENFIKKVWTQQVRSRSTTLLTSRGFFKDSVSRGVAAAHQMKDWWLGTPEGQFVCMGVISTGSYGAPPDAIFS